MDAAKSRTYLWQAWLAGGMILLLNPLSLKLALRDPFLEEKVLPLLVFIDLICLTLFFFLLQKQVSLKKLFETAPVFNLLFTILLILALFASNRVFTCKFKLIRVLFLLVWLFQYLRTFHMLVIKNPFNLSKTTRNIGTLEFAFGLIFILLEIGFMFPAKSRGAFPDSFSQINWNLKYLGQFNSRGMREVEIPAQKPRGKKVVFFLGDSFQYGWGVKNQHERASELVEKRLGLEIFNLGVPGSDIVNQWENLEETAWKPDQLVAFWNPNDIHRSANAVGLRMDAGDNNSQLENWPNFLTHYSYSLNWLKNEWFKPSSWNAYIHYLDQAFHNKKILETHIDQDWKLEYQEMGSGSTGKTLIVLFPLIGNVKVSVPWLAGMESWLNNKGWEVINLAPLLEEYPVEELIVNGLDMHPNEKVNAIVADTVSRRLQEN